MHNFVALPNVNGKRGDHHMRYSTLLRWRGRGGGFPSDEILQYVINVWLLSLRKLTHNKLLKVF